MKIQGLAVIAIMILLPISLVLTTYINAQAKTLSLQVEYDNKLKNTTYDALKAFQLNTANSDSSDIANSKIRDVEAGAKTFFNSLATNFNMPGYSKETLGEYVPALVFTMYDGYYIYAPYDNELDQTNHNIEKDEYGNKVDIGSDADNLPEYDLSDPSKPSNLTYYQGQDLTGLKSYVYYSCRYKRGPNLDVVITYSLDNYIVVKGIDKSGRAVDLHGYLLNDVNYSDPNNYIIGGNNATYRNVNIGTENNTKENIFLSGEGVDTGFYQLNVRKINGVRSFVVTDAQSGWNFGGKDRVYALLSGKWSQQNYLSATEQQRNGGRLDLSKVHKEDVIKNTNAVQYYRKALKLKKDLDDAGISELQVKDIVEGNEKWEDSDRLQSYFGDNGGEAIFGELDSTGTNGVGIEEPQSKFNQHRLSVIKYAIEKNLSAAINNFNLYSTSDTRFQMPKLKETDWDLIYNNICILSFMQGLNIGGRLYSGYTVVPNNNNKEVVTDDSIQVVAQKKQSNGLFGEPEIYEPTFKEFVDNPTEYNILGAFSRNTLAMVATEDLSTRKAYYYYRFWNDSVSSANSYSSPKGVPNTLAWSSYNSVVTSKDNNSDYTIKNGPNSGTYDSIFDYIDATGNNELKKAYYTALAREREGMYRVENDDFVSEHVYDSE